MAASEGFQVLRSRRVQQLADERYHGPSEELEPEFYDEPGPQELPPIAEFIRAAISANAVNARQFGKSMDDSAKALSAGFTVIANNLTGALSTLADAVMSQTIPDPQPKSKVKNHGPRGSSAFDRRGNKRY